MVVLKYLFHTLTMITLDISKGKLHLGVCEFHPLMLNKCK